MRIYKKFKRIIDISFSLLFIIILLPFSLLVLILIKLDSKGPGIFKQERVGENLKTFQIFKFRTMSETNRVLQSTTEIYGKIDGVTKIGYWLRRLKIDELPQLINIFIGHMSFIGPRPTLIKNIDHKNGDSINRYKVKPGLTGLAQVNGNIYLPVNERYKYDLKYINNLSLLLDIKILMKTIGVLIFGEQKFLKKDNNEKKN